MKVRKRKGIIISSVLLGVTAMILLLLLGAQHFLNSNRMKGIVTELAEKYTDGELAFDGMHVSLFRHFPHVTVELEDFRLTYPEENCCNPIDTLASFRRLALTVNAVRALSGSFIIPHASLDRARIHYHQYDSLHSNLDILKFPSSEKDTVPTGLPHVVVREVALTGHPEVVCTSAADTLYAVLKMDEARFHGKFSTDTTERSHLNLDISQLEMEADWRAGHYRFNLEELRLRQQKGTAEDPSPVYDLQASAQADLALPDRRSLEIPMDAGCRLSFPTHHLKSFSVRDFQLQIAPFHLYGKGDVRLYPDQTYLQAEVQMDECKAGDIIQWLGKSFLPSLRKIRTDAVFSLTALCDGFLIPAEKKLPSLLLEMDLPAAHLEHADLDRKGVLEANINAESDEYGSLSVRLDEIRADLAGIALEGEAAVEDVFGPDPLISLKASGKTSLDTLGTFLPDSLGWKMAGRLDAEVDGMFFLSDLDFYNFAGADISGLVYSPDIRLHYLPGNLEARLKDTRISLQPTNEKLDRNISLGGEIQALYAEIDSVQAGYGGLYSISGSKISAIAQNAASAQTEEFGEEYHPIIAQISAGDLHAADTGSLFGGMKHSVNLLKISNKRHGNEIRPIFSVKSANDRIYLRMDQGRYGLNHAGFNVSAVMEQPMDAIQDGEPGQSGSTPSEWEQAVKRYIDNWKVKGAMEISQGMVITPYFPLRNSFKDIQGQFDNEQISLDRLSICSGHSDLSARGKISGIRPALQGKAPLQIQMDLTSREIDLDELMGAWEKGSQWAAHENGPAADLEASDEEYLSSVTREVQDTCADVQSSLLLPDRLDAVLTLNAEKIRYAELETSWLSSEMAMKEQCLQLTNTLATSNMGDIYCEGFYSSRNPEKLKAGFDLNMASITADKVITLFPAIDTLMPMLKSFKGILDCEFAAVSDLDSNMNLLGDSINGVMKIRGKDLQLSDLGPMKKLARTLKFNNRNEVGIDDMSVEGLIQNNELQIFPFVLQIDRYLLAASGIQQFDQHFKYHVSILESPVPFRFGIDLKGNFDDWGFRLGKARYKNRNVPVFTTQLDHFQMNLVNSIHQIFSKGIERVVQQTEAGTQELEENRKKAGVDLENPSEALSTEELMVMEEALVEAEAQETNNDETKQGK